MYYYYQIIDIKSEVVWVSFWFFSALDPSWDTLSVNDSPPATEDNFEFTYIKDASGNIIRVTIDQAPNDAVPFFAANKDTRFQLFTLKNPTEPQLLLLDNSTTIEESNFNHNLDTRIFIHGWYEKNWSRSKIWSIHFQVTHFKICNITVQEFERVIVEAICGNLFDPGQTQCKLY